MRWRIASTSSELGEVARLAQDFDADASKRLADGRVAGAEAGAGQRLVFPGPGLFSWYSRKASMG
jgi:hypothetical protein